MHGTTNIYMVAPVNPNGPLVATRWYNGASNLVSFLYNGTVNFQDDTVGASGTAGVGFADAAANASKICNTCHTNTGSTYQHNVATVGHSTTPCLSCHAHEFDNN